MINKLKPKSEFSRNVLTLMTGTTIAQAIPIAISPILTRLYTPEDFGILALFVAITSIFGTIANGRYELAIMLPKKDEDAINIFALGFIIVFCLSLFLLSIILLFHNSILQLLNNQDIGFWLYFVPLTVFFIGLYNLLNYFNNRKKQYKDLAKATIVKSIVTAIVQLSIGFLKGGVAGLISGQILSQLFANMKLLKNIIENKVLISKVSKVKIVVLAKRYKDFPKFTMWAGLLNSSSTHLTNILISSLFNIKILGFYSLSQRLLGMPSALIGGSIGQVFFQEATKEKQLTGTAINTFISTLKKLIIIGVPFFGVLFFVVKDLFSFVFGEEWRVAGEYTQILIPFFMINFISSPLAISMSVFERQKSTLFVNIIIIISTFSVLFISTLYHIKFIVFLTIFSIVMCINYLLFIFYYNKIVKGVL